MMHNNYSNETYNVYVSSLDKRPMDVVDGEIGGFCLSRWQNGDRRYPLWANRPAEVLERGLIPRPLLRPGDLPGEVNDWITDALVGEYPLPEDPEAFEKLQKYVTRKEALNKIISELRETVDEWISVHLDYHEQRRVGFIVGSLSEFVQKKENKWPA